MRQCYEAERENLQRSCLRESCPDGQTCGIRKRSCLGALVARRRLHLYECSSLLSTPVQAGSNSPASAGGAFAPTVSNTEPPPAPTPRGMVWIPGGEFSMGAADPPDTDMVGMSATTDSRPIHRVYVDGFFMDKTDVTNAQFAEFVKATHHDC